MKYRSFTGGRPYAPSGVLRIKNDEGVFFHLYKSEAGIQDFVKGHF